MIPMFVVYWVPTGGFSSTGAVDHYNSSYLCCALLPYIDILLLVKKYIPSHEQSVHTEHHFQI